MTSLSSKGGSGDGPAVELIVKSANQSFDDLKVQCENCWSVRKLKTIITEKYPCKLVSSPSSSSFCVAVWLFLILSVCSCSKQGIKTTQKKILSQLGTKFSKSKCLVSVRLFLIVFVGWVR